MIDTTNQVYDFYAKKLGDNLALRIVLKSLAITSARLSFPRVFLIDSTPSGEYKTFTSKVAQSLFPKSWTLNVGSDFTIHSLFRETKTKENFGTVDKKCLLVNDATLLFLSKAEKTKQRLVNAFTELMTDKSYRYADFSKSFEIAGRMSFIMNITTKSYTRNLDRLIGQTFDERCLTVHSELSMKECIAIDHNLPEFQETKPKTDILTSNAQLGIVSVGVGSVHCQNVNLDAKYEHDINALTSEFVWRSIKDFPRSKATVIGLLRANALLCGRDTVSEKDFWICEKVLPHLINPLQPNKPRIVQLLRQGKTVSQICELIGKNTDAFMRHVYRVQKEAKEKGLLS